LIFGASERLFGYPVTVSKVWLVVRKRRNLIVSPLMVGAT
jgi:hypothetical protein